MLANALLHDETLDEDNAYAAAGVERQRAEPIVPQVAALLVAGFTGADSDSDSISSPAVQATR